jgi:glycosyltransferase involved in cell wall biosynthesis
MLLTHDTPIEESFRKRINFSLVKCLKGSRPAPATRLVHTPVNISILRKTIKDLSPESVFVNSNIDTLFQTYLATSRKIKTGYNVFFNNPQTKHHLSMWELCDHFVASTAVSKVLAHTHFQKRMYNKIGIGDERIAIIPHCIDINRISDSLENEGRHYKTKSIFDKENPVIFYGGYLGLHKGIVELVLAYEKVVDNVSATLVLCGNGPLREWIFAQERRIKKSNKMARIIVMPSQPSSTFIKELNNASIFVLPSHTECFGMVLLEAMSLKKPIVATYSGGPSEIITDKTNGLLVNPGDIDGLAEAILELLRSSKTRDTLGSNAYTTVQSKYEVSKVAPQFVRFMEEEA